MSVCQPVCYLEEYITVVAHPRSQRSSSNHPPVVREDRVTDTGAVVPRALGEGSGGGATHIEEAEDNDGDQDDDGHQDDAASPQPQIVIDILVTSWLFLQS